MLFKLLAVFLQMFVDLLSNGAGHLRQKLLLNFKKCAAGRQAQNVLSAPAFGVRCTGWVMYL